MSASETFLTRTLCRLAALTALFAGAGLIASSTPAQAAPGPITGVIDGIFNYGDQYYIQGWACAMTSPEPIQVHVYLGGPAGSGQLYTAVTASTASEPAVAAACQSFGSAYRFLVPVTWDMMMAHGGESIWVHGISPNGLPNSLLANSGHFSVIMPGPVLGVVDGIWVDPTTKKTYLYGWSCTQYDPNPTAVHVYAGGPAGGGTFATWAVANAPSEQAVRDACQAQGNHRYFIEITPDLMRQFGLQPLYVHGISADNQSNNLLAQSGKFTFAGLLDPSVYDLALKTIMAAPQNAPATSWHN